MEKHTRKTVLVAIKYAEVNFSEADWYTFGEITDEADTVANHGRLLRSMSFGDPDYSSCVAEVMFSVFKKAPDRLEEVIELFGIDDWYQREHPEKYEHIFKNALPITADFWKPGYIRMFISHLTTNKTRMSQLKESLDSWGICAFVAHEDIAVTRQWRDEVELGLKTMDVLIAVVEKGFKESDWCSQEVGYALGRSVAVIPLRAGLDPYGFFGKYQGLQIKGKLPNVVADELAQLIFSKSEYRPQVITCLLRSLPHLDSDSKIKKLNQIDGWSCLSEGETKTILEESSLSDDEKSKLKDIITRVKAFESKDEIVGIEDDIPF